MYSFHCINFQEIYSCSMVLSDYVFAVFHIDRSRNMEITARELYVRMTVYL